MASAKEISIRRSGDVAVVQAPTYISGESGQQISGAVTSLQHEGVTGVVINMSDCTTVTSVGMHALLQVLGALGDAGSRLRFCCATRAITKALRVMGLLKGTAIHDGEDEAIAAVSAAGAPET